MKTWRMLIALLAFILLAAGPALAAWSLGEAAKPYKGATIHVRIPTHPSTRATTPLIKEFEQATGITVDYNNQMVSRDLIAKQDIELATGAVAYDVMFISDAAVPGVGSRAIGVDSRRAVVGGQDGQCRGVDLGRITPAARTQDVADRTSAFIQP